MGQLVSSLARPFHPARSVCRLDDFPRCETRRQRRHTVTLHGQATRDGPGCLCCLRTRQHRLPRSVAVSHDRAKPLPLYFRYSVVLASHTCARYSGVSPSLTSMRNLGSVSRVHCSFGPSVAAGRGVPNSSTSTASRRGNDVAGWRQPPSADCDDSPKERSPVSTRCVGVELCRINRYLASAGWIRFCALDWRFHAKFHATS